MLTGGGAGRYGGAAGVAGSELNVDFNGRITARIKDLAGGDGGDGCIHTGNN